jgi:hypothetical protein
MISSSILYELNGNPTQSPHYNDVWCFLEFPNRLANRKQTAPHRAMHLAELNERSMINRPASEARPPHQCRKGRLCPPGDYYGGRIGDSPPAPLAARILGCRHCVYLRNDLQKARYVELDPRTLEPLPGWRS